MLKRFLAALFCLLVWVSTQAAAPAGKAHQLSPEQTRALIDAAKTLKTADGATVIEVLQYAEKQRPTKFRLVTMETAGSPQEPKVTNAVLIECWIGPKSAEEQLLILTLKVSYKDGKPFVEAPYYTKEQQSDFPYGAPEDRLIGGRASFLKFIDQALEEDCVDPETHQKTC